MVSKMFFRDLETSRLYLKNISPEDREFVFTQFSNDDVNQFLFDAEPLTSYGCGIVHLKFIRNIKEARNGH